MQGSLAGIEAAVVEAESTSHEAAAEKLRPDIGYEGSLRWLRRRVRSVHRALEAVMDLRLEPLAPIHVSSITAFQQALGRVSVLVELRALLEADLPFIPSPLGFLTASPRSRERPPHDLSRAPPG
jgi:hypothetical protein